MRCLVDFQGLNCTRWHGLWCSITFARIDYPQDQLSSTEPMTQKNWLCTKIRKTDDISVKGNRCDHQSFTKKKPRGISQCAAEYIFESSFEPIKVIVYWSSDRCIRLAIADSCKFHEIWLVFFGSLLSRFLCHWGVFIVNLDWKFRAVNRNDVYGI